MLSQAASVWGQVDTQGNGLMGLTPNDVGKQFLIPNTDQSLVSDLLNKLFNNPLMITHCENADNFVPEIKEVHDPKSAHSLASLE